MSEAPKRWFGPCLGGGCAFGYCENSKALGELLLDVYVSAEVSTTIASVGTANGCDFCDRVKKIPQPVYRRKRDLVAEDVTDRDEKLTRLQAQKATTT